MNLEQMIDQIGTGTRPISAARKIFGQAKPSWAVMLRNYCWNKLTFVRHPNAIVPTQDGVGTYNDIALHIYNEMPDKVRAVADTLTES
jgi:hypothetical protein